MEAKTGKINFDAENLAFLERLEEVPVLGTEVASAPVAAIPVSEEPEVKDLSVVEDVPVPKIEAEEPVVRPDIRDLQALKQTWNDIPISMGEVVTKIFELSDRPFILIRDDTVVYLNKTAMGILELSEPNAIIGGSFWDYVDPQDWNLLSDNIGAMLTEDKVLEVRLRTSKERIYKIKLQAAYVEDGSHFTFFLAGGRKLKYNPNAGLYDAVTGLPNFYLFEDRLQFAINNERYKDVRQRRNMLAVLGVSIDNLDFLRKLNMADFVLKKLASKLVFRLKKTYTVARGLKYQFWFLINDFNNKHDLEVEVSKILAIFGEPVEGNYMDYNIQTSFGYSVYPDDAATANKLVEAAIEQIVAKSQVPQN